MDMKVEQIICKKCGNPMPKIRYSKYGYEVCVECSAIKPKSAIDVVYGEGDHTWNSIIIVDADTAEKLPNKEVDREELEENAPEMESIDEIPLQIPVKDRIKSFYEEDTLEFPEDCEAADVFEEEGFYEEEEDDW